MGDNMEDTIDYYNKNAKQFVSNTVSVNLYTIQNRFLSKLPKSAYILDLGCGSGRDTRYFLEQGFHVAAIDGSEELCKLAEEYTGIAVKHMLFQELDEMEVYNGIWACSSILHVPFKELKAVMMKMEKAVKPKGVLYISFKYGNFEGSRNGRYFTDMTEDKFNRVLKELNRLFLEEQWVTSDARPGRGKEQWLNIILRKN